MADRLPPAPVLVLALAVPLLSLVHTCQGYLASSPPDRVFMGFRYMAADHFQYAAFMRQAQQDGRLLMNNLLTSEPQRGVYVLLYFWILGEFARLSGLSLTTTWEVFQVLCGMLYILLFWALTAHYFDTKQRRLFATVLLRATVLPGINPLEYTFDHFWNSCP